MTSPCRVYLCRNAGFAPSGNTTVSVAPLHCIVAVYGNGGVVGERGLSSACGRWRSSRTMRLENFRWREPATPRSFAASIGLICKLLFARKLQMLDVLSGERKKRAPEDLVRNEGQPEFG
jgi:hypothetical protein